MKKRLFTLLTVAAFSLGLCQTAAAQETAEIIYSPYFSGESTSFWGTGKGEKYDIAIHITDPALVGQTITGVSVNIPSSTTGIDSKAAVFLTKTLALSGKNNVADVLTDSFTVASGWQDITFSQPYTITADGVYVGYTLNVTSAQAGQSIFTVDKGSAENLYVHTARTYRKWTDKSESLSKAAAIKVKVQTSTMNGASIACEGANAEVGKTVTLHPVITNVGAKGVKSFDYTVDFQGEKLEKHVTLSSPLDAQFGSHTSFAVTLPTIKEAGTQKAVFTVTKVNGVANETTANTASPEIVVYAFLPVKRPLCEEYTGTWCGWCPRGFVGMENLYKTYGDDFCGVAYHSGDPMAFTNDYSSSVSDFPSFFVDRTYSSDAYCGDNYDGHYHVNDVYKKFSSTLAPAALSVKAYFTDANTIHVVSSVIAAADITNNNRYQMSYILTADSLTGTSSNWAQSNYYPGRASQYPDADMKEFTQGSSSVTGLVYNFVGVQRSGKNGISGSLPSTLPFNQEVTHEYDFDISKNSIIQHKDKLHVIAVIIDSQDNGAVNAAKSYVYSSETTGINNVDSKDATPVAYYTLDGKQLSQPAKGLNVVRLSDGRVLKMLNK